MVEKRFVAIRPEVVASDGELAVELATTELQVWAIEFALLLEGLVSSLTFIGASGTTVVLTVDPDQHAVRTVVTRPAANRFEFRISREQVEFIYVFLLRAYRDGLADVDHIHVEGALQEQEFDLTLLFDAAKPPLSPEETAKLLDSASGRGDQDR